MNNIILPYVVGFVLQELAAENFTAEAPKFDAWLETASPWLKAHPRTVHLLESVAHPALAAIQLAVRDEPDMKAAILALAAKNLPAAEAAVLSIAKVAVPALGGLLGAA